MADSTSNTELVVRDDLPAQLPISDEELALIERHLGDIIAEVLAADGD